MNNRNIREYLQGNLIIKQGYMLFDIKCKMVCHLNINVGLFCFMGSFLFVCLAFFAGRGDCCVAFCL